MTASIQVTGSPVSDGPVNFTCSGFPAIALINLYVNGIEVQFNYLTDDNGNCSSEFYDNDPPGAYILKAVDNYGNTAQTQFTLSVNNGGATGTPTLDVTNSPVTTYGSSSTSWAAGVDFSFSGFATVEGGLVDIYVIGSSGSKRLVTNDLLYGTVGSGSDSFLDLDPPGTYTLQAADNYGNSAQTQFTLVAASSGSGGGGGGSGSNTGGSGTPTNWAGIISSLIPWVVIFVAIYLFAPLLKSWIMPKPKQRQLPAGTQVIELPPGSYNTGGR